MHPPLGPSAHEQPGVGKIRNMVFPFPEYKRSSWYQLAERLSSSFGLAYSIDLSLISFVNSYISSIKFEDESYCERIETRAFANCAYLKSVVIPNGVKKIGDGAFEWSSIESVMLPDSIVSIGDNAFGYCYNLTDINIPNGVTEIGGGAFRLCQKLQNISLPEGIKTIENYTFNCCSLKEIIIPTGVVEIGYDSFWGCEKLTTITIPDSVTTINDVAFGYCDSLTDVFFTGTKEEWEAIEIGDYNESLINANIHFKEIGNESGVIIDNTNYNAVPENTKLNVSLLEEKKDGIVYDITLTSNGIEIQPNGIVTVKIPVSDEYDVNSLSVYRAEDGTYIDMNAVYENGYMVFITDHFSKYVITTKDLSISEEPEYNYSFSIQKPSRTEIRNKDGIILHANVEGTAPNGSYVRWESSNGYFDTSADGSNLKIIAKNKGYTTFTAILCDADGNELARDSVEMYSKSGFFDKIGGFFRSLFGTTKIYDN